MNQHEMWELKQMQSLPLKAKIPMTIQRIRGWIDHWGEDGVYVSFSGGKDSTVLLDIIRNRMEYDVMAVYVDTGLEYPEVKEFVKSFDNVTILRPKMSFKQVLEKYGYPMISKEVSGSVDAAKKYLTKLADSESILQTDRQTDRQLEECVGDSGFSGYRAEKVKGWRIRRFEEGDYP